MQAGDFKVMLAKKDGATLLPSYTTFIPYQQCGPVFLQDKVISQNLTG